ncbi:transcriptional coactivator/pterin dehydratase [Aspergillus crustosus]
MNPASRGCQRFQKSLFGLHSMCTRQSRAHQLPHFFQSRCLRTGGSPCVATRRASTMTSGPHFAEGIDSETLHPVLNELQNQGWSLDEDKIGIKKTFYYRSYFKAVAFVNSIASESASKKHHATITLRFGSVEVHWTTHHPRGLTDKDTSMAQYCDQAAELMGAVQEGHGQKCGPAA